MRRTSDSLEISMRGAIDVIDAAITRAEAIGVRVVVWVVDRGGHDVAMTRMDGSLLLSRQVAADKAWTAVAVGMSTLDWVTAIEADPLLDNLGAGNRTMSVPGGVPLRVGGEVVGAVGVSGASAQQDHDIAMAGAAVLEG